MSDDELRAAIERYAAATLIAAEEAAMPRLLALSRAGRDEINKRLVYRPKEGR